MIFAKPNSGGGFGAGASGLLQGLIAGQQSKESNQRMDALQLQQDRQTEAYETDKMFGHINNVEMLQKAGKDSSGAVKSLNDFKSKSTNYADGNTFSVQNIHQFKDDNGNYSNEFINKYKADTGKDWLPGSMSNEERTSAENYVDGLGQQVMMGDQVFDPDTFTAGSSNYKKYKADAELTKQLQQAKIATALGTPKDPSNMKEYARLKAIPESQRTDDEQAQFTAYQAKVGRTKNDAQDKIASYVTNTEMKNEFEALKNGGSLNQEVYSKLLKTEQQSGNVLPDKGKDLNSRLTAFRDSNQVIADVTQLMDEGTNMGITKSMASDAAKLGDNKELSGAEYAKQMRTIMAKSKIGGMMSRYLKAVSGSAVTEEEYGRILRDLVGGDITKVNADTITAAMNASKDSQSKTLGSEVNDLDVRTPASKMKFMDQYNRSKNVQGSNPSIKNRGQGTKTIEQSGASAVAEEAEATIEFGSKVAGTLIDKVFNKDDKTKPTTIKDVKFDSNLEGLERRKAYAEVLTELEDEKKYSNAEVKQWFVDNHEGLTVKERSTFIKKFTPRGDK